MIAKLVAKLPLFYVAATFAAGGDLARCYRQRWLTESFFKSAKHGSSFRVPGLKPKHLVAGIPWLGHFHLVSYTLNNKNIF